MRAAFVALFAAVFTSSCCILCHSSLNAGKALAEYCDPALQSCVGDGDSAGVTPDPQILTGCGFLKHIQVTGSLYAFRTLSAGFSGAIGTYMQSHFLYQRFPCYFNTQEPDTVIIAAVAYPNGVFWNLIEAKTGIVHYTIEGPGGDVHPPLSGWSPKQPVGDPPNPVFTVYNGNCSYLTGSGVWVCDCLPNYFGDNCQFECDPAVTCNGNGGCNATNGHCICKKPFSGEHCDVCGDGRRWLNGSCSCGPNNQYCPSHGNRDRTYEIIGGAAGGGVLLLAGICVSLYCMRKKAEKLRPLEVSIHKLDGNFPSSISSHGDLMNMASISPAQDFDVEEASVTPSTSTLDHRVSKQSTGRLGKALGSFKDRQTSRDRDSPARSRKTTPAGRRDSRKQLAPENSVLTSFGEVVTPAYYYSMDDPH